MKKYFSIFFLLLSFSVVQAFVSCSASGEYDKSVETFVNSLRNGFKGEKTLFTANSVELKGKRVHIEVVSDSSGKGIKAEAMFEILAAAKEFLNDKEIPVSGDFSGYMRAFEAKGIDFCIKLSDASTGEEFVVDYTPEEFFGIYSMNDQNSTEALAAAVMEYVPFERQVFLFNSMAEGSGASFSCEDGYMYISIPMGEQDFKEFKEMFDFDSVLLASMMKKPFLEGVDESSRMFMGLARRNNYKLGLKIVSQGYEPLLISLE